MARRALSDMTVEQVLAELQAAGTEQNRKTYARHRTVGPILGVSYANLDKLTKMLRGRHDLAEPLWESTYSEARVLAARLLQPGPGADDILESWWLQVADTTLAIAVGETVARFPDPLPRLQKTCWHDDQRGSVEFIRGLGFNALAYLAVAGGLDEKNARVFLDDIAYSIRTERNYTRYAMNGALIAIGSHISELTERALEIAAKIGKVEVDHGDTSCKTPDAADYIRKTRAYLEKKASRR